MKGGCFYPVLVNLPVVMLIQSDPVHSVSPWCHAPAKPGVPGTEYDCTAFKLLMI